MKKFLLSLSFMLPAFINVSAASNGEGSQTTSQDGQVEFFAEQNNQLILSALLDGKTVQEKGFFDLSIKEIWTKKLKPLLASNKFIVLSLFIFSAIQIGKLDNIATGMLWQGDFANRYKLRKSFDVSATFLMLPYVCLVAGIVADTIFNILVDTARAIKK